MKRVLSLLLVCLSGQLLVADEKGPADDQYIAFIASPQAVPLEFLDDTPDAPHTPGLYIVHVKGAMPVRLEAAGESAIRPVWQPASRD